MAEAMAKGLSPIGQASTHFPHLIHAVYCGFCASKSFKSKTPDVSLVIGASLLTAAVPIMAPPKIIFPIREVSEHERLIKNEAGVPTLTK